MPKAADLIQQQIEGIDENIATIERSLKKYDQLKVERDKLRAARRALTGGSRLTGGGGNQIRQEDIVGWLNDHPGSSLTQITDAVGGTSTQISSHLSRGKNERFLNSQGLWWVRDPKNGLNTVEDVEKLMRKMTKEENEDD